MDKYNRNVTLTKMSNLSAKTSKTLTCLFGLTTVVNTTSTVFMQILNILLIFRAA